MGIGVLDPGQFGFGTRRDAELPTVVGAEFLLAPVAEAERRVRDDGVDRQLREGVVP
jgi:hypothetical protein